MPTHDGMNHARKPLLIAQCVRSLIPASGMQGQTAVPVPLFLSALCFFQTFDVLSGPACSVVKSVA